MSALFKSKREREREARRERRRAFRQAENQVDAVKERIRGMDKDAQRIWEEAREATKAGQKAASRRHLTSYRAAQVLMTKLEQKRWVFEQYMMKMEAAQTDAEFANALEAVNRVTAVDPERVADVFDASEEILGEQMDTDRFWSRLYEKQMDGAKESMDDYIPSVDELAAELQNEAAAEVGTASERVGGDLDKRISDGQARVKDMLDGRK